MGGPVGMKMELIGTPGDSLGPVQGALDGPFGTPRDSQLEGEDAQTAQIANFHLIS